MKTITTAIDKHRLAGLQDGVYSFAMTLLVLELKLPPLPEQLTNALLWSALLAIWPKLLTWLLSFWVLTVFWTSDSRALQVFTVFDSFLLRLSLCRLALVGLIPFSTALLGQHGNLSVGASVYSAHLFLLAGIQVVRNAYSSRHPEVVAWPTTGAESEATAKGWATLICAGMAFALAFSVPGYNMFALLPLLLFRFTRIFRSP